MDDFEFFVIRQQTGLSNQSGILGLSPTSKDSTTAYVYQLKSNGEIDNQVFTFWINLMEENSMITFGGVPNNSTRGDTYSQGAISKYNSWWTVKMRGLSYGDDDIQASNI